MGGGDENPYSRFKATATILSICDQTNIRVYNRFVLCFPTDGSPDAPAKIAHHIRQSLDVLAKRRPEFAGRLELAKVQHRDKQKTGYLCLRQSPVYSIPFKSEDLSGTFGYTYESLRSRGFPASAFVHRRFEIPADLEKGDVPVTQMKTLFIKGGFLLCLWLHHGLADGECIGEFLGNLSLISRNDPEPVQRPRCLELKLEKYAEKIETRKSFEELVDECAEYGVHPTLASPTHPIELRGGTPVAEIEKAGKIFVFGYDKLESLKEKISSLLGTNVSSYTCLAALTWAHVTKARQMENFAPRQLMPTSEGRLMNPVNWKLRRTLEDATKDYFGNATALAITKIGVPQLHHAASGSLEAMALIAQAVAGTIRGINDDFVCQRLATYYAAPDPRFLGLNIDPRTTCDLGFNTWRRIGADTVWNIPGVGFNVKPDAVRRAQGVWNMGGALIMPARSGCNAPYELLVTLPRVSMERLCCDSGYRAWVDRVID